MQIPARRLADLGYAQGHQHSIQWRSPRFVDCGHQVFGGLRPHAIEARELVDVERIQLADPGDDVPFDELVDDLDAEAVDVERIPGAEVEDGRPQLGRAAIFHFGTAGIHTHAINSDL